MELRKEFFPICKKNVLSQINPWEVRYGAKLYEQKVINIQRQLFSVPR